MSYAIFELDIEAPAASVRRVQCKSGIQWVVRCEFCRRVTRPRPLLSAAMREQFRHGRSHYFAMLNRAVSTARPPSVPSRTRSTGRLAAGTPSVVSTSAQPPRRDAA